VDAVRLFVLGATGLMSIALAGTGVLLTEYALACRRGFLPPDGAPMQDTVVGARSGPALRLAMLGDSTACGVGVREGAETVGGQLAQAVAATGRCVRLSSSAVANSAAGDLGPQVSRALLGHPDVAVILIGAGDVRRCSAISRSAERLGGAVRRLSEAGVRVVVGTCPDLGSTPAWPQPLRTVIGARGAMLATAQAAATRVAGGTAVDLAARTGRVFRADRGTYCEDRLHPSADGYRLWAEALLPAVTRAAGTPATI